MKYDLDGQVVIITGGGGAIGSAMARQFADDGANVVVADQIQDSLDAVVTEIQERGGEIHGIIADVSSKQSATRMVEETVARYGKLDCLVNNAGINGGPEYRKPIHEYDDDLWDRILNVDLNGIYYCSKPAIKQMIAQGHGGNIINIGSLAGLTPLRLQCAFTAAKAGVFNLTKAMALELAEFDIRVNSIAPGSIVNKGTKAMFYSDPVRNEALMSHIPMKRPGEPEEIAAMTCFLASKGASYMTGSVITIDGGWICGYTRDF